MARTPEILSLVSFLMVTIAGVSAQDDAFIKNIQKRANEREQEKANRPIQENKLHGELYAVLRLAEAADTSVQSQKRLRRLITLNKNYHVDGEGRIIISLHVRSVSDSSTLIQRIRSLGGFVERVGKFTPFIFCRIQPKKMRVFITMEEIIGIDPFEPGNGNKW